MSDRPAPARRPWLAANVLPTIFGLACSLLLVVPGGFFVVMYLSLPWVWMLTDGAHIVDNSDVLMALLLAGLAINALILWGIGRAIDQALLKPRPARA